VSDDQEPSAGALRQAFLAMVAEVLADPRLCVSQLSIPPFLLTDVPYLDVVFADEIGVIYRELNGFELSWTTRDGFAPQLSGLIRIQLHLFGATSGRVEDGFRLTSRGHGSIVVRGSERALTDELTYVTYQNSATRLSLSPAEYLKAVCRTRGLWVADMISEEPSARSAYLSDVLRVFPDLEAHDLAFLDEVR
jgi:hypothetical protein